MTTPTALGHPLSRTSRDVSSTNTASATTPVLLILILLHWSIHSRDASSIAKRILTPWLTMEEFAEYTLDNEQQFWDGKCAGLAPPPEYLLIAHAAHRT
jgi:hypothetical protein